MQQPLFTTVSSDWVAPDLSTSPALNLLRKMIAEVSK